MTFSIQMPMNASPQARFIIHERVKTFGLSSRIAAVMVMATEDQIQGLIERHGLIFIKPGFRCGSGKKGKAGLGGRARSLEEALAEKERLYYCEHSPGYASGRSHGVTLEPGVPA